VRQSLPFMNFSSAKWEILLAVGISSAANQALTVCSDERAVRPAKRVGDPSVSAKLQKHRD
jgi:hypothetical protein